jgi:hypothetical protein
MDDQQVTTPDVPAPTEPATPPVAPVSQPDEPITPPPSGEPTTPPPPADPSAPAPEPATPTEELEDYEYQNYQIPNYQPLDLTNLPVDENNLVDPNALAQTINQSIAAASERATLMAQQSYQEQRIEEKSWDKAYEKYPELKTNKELRDIVHRTRLGEVTDLLSRSQNPQSVKLPTPGQVAEKLFKHLGTARADGVRQANENTVIQASAHIESGSRAASPDADAHTKARQNINNPNREVAKQARQELLKSMVFGNS